MLCDPERCGGGSVPLLIPGTRNSHELEGRVARLIVSFHPLLSKGLQACLNAVVDRWQEHLKAVNFTATSKAVYRGGGIKLENLAKLAGVQ